MVKEELIQRSPVRIFMDSIHGGLGPGELGVVASPSGTGKTSVLVQIALDKLLLDEKVIHISFTRHTDHILAWYEDIFDEFIKKKNLENQQDVKNDIIKNRVLMKFTQDGISSEQITRSLRALIKEGGFNAKSIIIDGFDFAAGAEAHVSAIKSFADEMGVSVWYSCNVKGNPPLYDQRGIPVVIKEYSGLFKAIIILEPKQDHIAMKVVMNDFLDKAADSVEHLAIKLDPKTLLMLQK